MNWDKKCRLCLTDSPIRPVHVLRTPELFRLLKEFCKIEIDKHDNMDLVCTNCVQVMSSLKFFLSNQKVIAECRGFQETMMAFKKENETSNDCVVVGNRGSEDDKQTLKTGNVLPKRKLLNGDYASETNQIVLTDSIGSNCTQSTINKHLLNIDLTKESNVLLPINGDADKEQSINTNSDISSNVEKPTLKRKLQIFYHTEESNILASNEEPPILTNSIITLSPVNSSIEESRLSLVSGEGTNRSNSKEHSNLLKPTTIKRQFVKSENSKELSISYNTGEDTNQPAKHIYLKDHNKGESNILLINNNDKNTNKALHTESILSSIPAGITIKRKSLNVDHAQKSQIILNSDEDTTENELSPKEKKITGKEIKLKKCKVFLARIKTPKFQKCKVSAYQEPETKNSSLEKDTNLCFKNYDNNLKAADIILRNTPDVLKCSSLTQKSTEITTKTGIECTWIPITQADSDSKVTKTPLRYSYKELTSHKSKTNIFPSKHITNVLNSTTVLNSPNLVPTSNINKDIQKGIIRKQLSSIIKQPDSKSTENFTSTVNNNINICTNNKIIISKTTNKLTTSTPCRQSFADTNDVQRKHISNMKILTVNELNCKSLIKPQIGIVSPININAEAETIGVVNPNTTNFTPKDTDFVNHNEDNSRSELNLRVVRNGLNFGIRIQKDGCVVKYCDLTEKQVQNIKSLLEIVFKTNKNIQGLILMHSPDEETKTLLRVLGIEHNKKILQDT